MPFVMMENQVLEQPVQLLFPRLPAFDGLHADSRKRPQPHTKTLLKFPPDIFV